MQREQASSRGEKRRREESRQGRTSGVAGDGGENRCRRRRVASRLRRGEEREPVASGLGQVHGLLSLLLGKGRRLEIPHQAELFVFLNGPTGNHRGDEEHAREVRLRHAGLVCEESERRRDGGHGQDVPSSSPQAASIPTTRPPSPRYCTYYHSSSHFICALPCPALSSSITRVSCTEETTPFSCPRGNVGDNHRSSFADSAVRRLILVSSQTVFRPQARP
jgi:hypothetical protein